MRTTLARRLKQSVKSATRERSPEMFANFIRGITDGEIGIKADAVRELYGDKPPVDGEGPLGFVSGLDEKLRAAEATGGDVQVPLADWLAKVEPDVAKELGDHIRARPEGMTVEEAKELPKPEAQPTVGELPEPATPLPLLILFAKLLGWSRSWSRSKANPPPKPNNSNCPLPGPPASRTAKPSPRPPRSG